jgi:hypothetical protein
MSAFAWLVLGHLLGDWVLQNDWMARGKKRQLLGGAGLVHAAGYTLTILGACWLSGCRGRQSVFYLGFGSLIFLSHWLIDGTRLVERWMRLYRQTDAPVVRLMVDQTLHVLVLAASMMLMRWR